MSVEDEQFYDQFTKLAIEERLAAPSVDRVTTAELLSCPFCGAANKQGYQPLMTIDGEVYCAGCGARGGTVDGTLRTAADRWNRRTALNGEGEQPEQKSDK